MLNVILEQWFPSRILKKQFIDHYRTRYIAVWYTAILSDYYSVYCYKQYCLHVKWQFVDCRSGLVLYPLFRLDYLIMTAYQLVLTELIRLLYAAMYKYLFTCTMYYHYKYSCIYCNLPCIYLVVPLLFDLPLSACGRQMKANTTRLKILLSGVTREYGLMNAVVQFSEA